MLSTSRCRGCGASTGGIKFSKGKALDHQMLALVSVPNQPESGAHIRANQLPPKVFDTARSCCWASALRWLTFAVTSPSSRATVGGNALNTSL